MTASDDLFHLIKSLSKSEKRHFKLFSSLTSGDKTYLKLFDAVEKQEVYNEAAIKKEYSGEAFIKQLTRTKLYLSEAILKSLDRYQSGPEAELKRLLPYVQILYGKGLYKQCEKTISKAMKLASLYENFSIMHELCDWELKIIYAQHATLKRLKEILLIKKTIRKRQANYDAYRSIGSWLIQTMSTGHRHRQSDLDIYKNIFAHSLMKSDANALSFLARRYYFVIKTSVYGALDDIPNAYKYALENIAMFEKNAHHIVGENEYYYYIALFNVGLAQLHLKKHKDLEGIIAKMRGAKIMDEVTRSNAIADANYFELNLYMQQANYETGLKRAQEIEKEISQTTILDKEKELLLYANFFEIHFANKRYKQAKQYLQVIESILLKIPGGVRNDIHCFVKVVFLVVYYEQGHMELLEYAVKSAYRFLLKKQTLYGFEKVFLEFIQKKLPKIYTEKQIGEAFKELRNKLVNVFKDPLEKNVAHYFDYVSWLDSKIENRPFVEVMREKAADNRQADNKQ